MQNISLEVANDTDVKEMLARISQYKVFRSKNCKVMVSVSKHGRDHLHVYQSRENKKC